MVAKVHYCKDTDLIWKRIKKGSGFAYVNKIGSPIPKDSEERFVNFKIPPAWVDVQLSPDPFCHVQVVGIDAKGKKQYIYHPEWVKKNQEHKFDQMISFGESLPALRRAIASHMSEHKLTKDRVTATVIWLLEHTFIRVGNKTYAEENQSYGLTTMREKHIKIKGNTLKFSFEGKSGVFHELDVTNPKVAKTVKACLDLPGYELFQYFDDDKNKKVVDSQDVNDYLVEYAGKDFSAKDFRTWGGSVIAGDSFYKKGKATDATDFKNKITEVVGLVSEQLGNTKNVCRKYYIHPAIIKSYESGVLVPHFEHSYNRKSGKKLSLNREEYATWSLIKDS